MPLNKLRLLLVLLPLISAIGLTACNAMAGKSAIEGKIDRLVMGLIDVKGRSQNKAPGIVVAYVWPHGTSVKGYGTTKIGTSSPPDGDTRFAIGSVSKVFTGLILAQAVKSGKVGLEDKVQPSLEPPLKDLFDPDITYRQLVTHTSGLVNFPTNLQDYRDNDGDGRNDFSQGNPANLYAKQDLVTCLQQKQCGKQHPTNQYHYSNLGSGILGIALQNELGFDNYADMLEGTVTGSLGMNDTGINEGEFARRLPERVAQGYFIQGQKAREAPYPNMGDLAGGGGIFSTGRDMLKFLGAVTGLEDTELSRAITEMKKELEATGNGRAIGYAVDIKNPGAGKRTEYAKAGVTLGYTAYLAWKDDPQVGVLVLVNRGKFKTAQKLAEKILSGLARNV